MYHIALYLKLIEQLVADDKLFLRFIVDISIFVNQKVTPCFKNEF